MEFQRGERVTFDFDSGAVGKLESENASELPQPVFPTFVGDILERDASQANPPVAPSLQPNANGFPAHKKRTPRVSAFKQQRAAKAQAQKEPPKPTARAQPTEHTAASTRDDEKRAIDEENKQRLATMSDAEIEEERRELMQSLDPALIQRLLARSNIDQGSNERDLLEPDVVAPPAPDERTPEPKDKASSPKKVSFATSEADDDLPTSTTTTTTSPPTQPTASIHFPRPSQPPTLDPADPNFLTSLHEKYFPSLPYDPSSLSWMTPLDPSDTSSPYHPSHTSLNPSDLRFDFTGALLAPSVARSLPTHHGLHHHADAPEAAGYTVPELAVMSRSAVAAQRCVAYQTLGRILYRLGMGEFGVERAERRGGPVQVAVNPDAEGGEEGEVEEEDVGSAMAAGLWKCVEDGRVIETLTEEAGRERGHLTARTFAQEALWNWRRGGGRRRQAV